MSGISGVGSGSSAIYPLTTPANADDTNWTIDDASSGALTGSQDNPGGNGTTATSPLADLRGQIETAVTNAVNQLPAGSSPQDIFSAVQSAVQSTLKANGLDPQQILSQGHGHHHHHAHGAGGAGGEGAAAGNDGDADDQQNTNPLTAPGSTSVDALVTLLQQITGNADSQSGGQSNGTGGQPNSGSTGTQSDPLLSALEGPSNGAAGQTNSLLSALQNSGSGVNVESIFLQLFQGFPSGTGLDVRA